METKWDWGDPNDRAGASGIIIENCKLHDSKYDVVKIKPNCDNITVSTGWEGIGLYGSKDAQIYNNTLVDVANGGEYHSAVYFGLTYQDWEDYAGRPANVNPNIHHNIVSLPKSNVRPMAEIRYADELGCLSALNGSLTINSNCYYIAGKKGGFYR